MASRCMSGRKVPERKESNDVKTVQSRVNAIRSENRGKDLEKFIREIQVAMLNYVLKLILVHRYALCVPQWFSIKIGL